jgi:hypothetical protein
MEDRELGEGYIKLYRNCLRHPIFQDREAWQLFTYCLLKANHKPGTVIFRRTPIHVERGQFVFGLERASQDLGLSIAKIRSALKWLSSLKVIARKTTNRFSIITLCNYSYYQGEGFEKSQASQQATRKQLATNNNDKNISMNIECNDFERLNAFLSSLPQYQSFPLEARELILEFLNRIRASNKTGSIQSGRVSGLVSKFRSIQEETNEESLLAGLKGAFRKAKRDGFDFKKRDPTGYVHAVAKSHRNETERNRLLARTLEERKVLRSATEGRVFQDLKEAFNLQRGGIYDERREEEADVSLQANHSDPV